MEIAAAEPINDAVQDERPIETNSNEDATVADEDVNMHAAANSSHLNGSHIELDADNCLARIVFRDGDTFDELHQIIGQCIRDALFLLKKPANLIVDKSDSCIQIHEIAAENDDGMFMVDTLPTENTNEAEIPDYNASITEVLNNEEAVINDPEAEDSGKSKLGNCWNCGGNHNMKDCKEKRDPVAISRAKQQFGMKMKTERYHLDASEKFNHLVPGQISDNLRAALGLRSRELPLFIYKMRLYGYPEGWLEEAKINHSGLSLFHTENSSKDIKEDDDGEVDKVTFDPSKFIEYPGFNAPVPGHLIDEGDFYRVPPMQFQNSKEGLTQLLQDSLAKTYKRKRLKLEPTGESANVKNDDMDIQSDNEEDSPVLLPQPRPDGTSPDEASLLELERKKEELRRALEDASSDSNSIPFDESVQPTELGEIDDKAIKNDNENEPEKVDETSILDTTPEVVTDVSEDVVPKTPLVTVAGRSREAHSGTPLIKAVSPYSKLPVGEKWSVGVTDVIDFENLPDSTGTYHKLTGVIQKVRTAVKRMTDEDHDSS